MTDFLVGQDYNGGHAGKPAAKGGRAVVLYPDLAFFLNSLTDLLALSATAKLAGLPLRWRRLLAAALLGGVYGAACLLPPLAFAGGLLPQAGIAMALVWIAFRRKETFLRQLLLFWLLSCAMGGALMALPQLLQNGSGTKILKKLNWKVFFLAGGTCYFLLSVSFRDGARHAIAGELTSCMIGRAGKTVRLRTLLDSGHTLTDPATGGPVLIVEAAALESLWTPAEAPILASLTEQGAAWCLARLEGRGHFRLLPYRAVGVDRGVLLCFTADSVAVGNKNYGPTAVALSPGAVSSEGGYAALWSGKDRRNDHAA